MTDWLRASWRQLVRRRARAPGFASVLDRTLREDVALTLRLSTVERSVGTDLDDPHSRVSLED